MQQIITIALVINLFVGLTFFCMGCQKKKDKMPVEIGYRLGETNLSKFELVQVPVELGNGVQQLALYKMIGDVNSNIYMKMLKPASDTNPPTFKRLPQF